MVFGKGKGKKSYSAKTLSRFGKLGGRPKKYNSPAERKRAWREKQAEKQGKPYTPRTQKNYGGYQKTITKTTDYIQCSNCQQEIIVPSDLTKSGDNYKIASWRKGKFGVRCRKCFENLSTEKSYSAIKKEVAVSTYSVKGSDTARRKRYYEKKKSKNLIAK